MKRKVIRLVAGVLAVILAAGASVAGLPAGIFEIKKVYAANEIAINTNNFPDPVFCQYLSSKYDSDNDGCIDNVVAVNMIEIDDSIEISSLVGIENFTELLYLRVYNSSFETVDLTACTMLRGITITKNDNLVSIDVTGLEYLGTLTIYKNTNLSQIIGLNTLSRLTWLSAYETALTSLDLRANSSLYELNVRQCQLEELLVDGLANLYDLECNNNKLTELNLEGCSRLASLSCGDNAWVAEEPIVLSDVMALKNFYCVNNYEDSKKIKKLNIPQNSALVEMKVNNNELTVLDASKASGLQVLECKTNLLTELTLNNPDLKTLFVGSNATENISLVVDTTNCPSLTYLNVAGSVSQVVINNPNLKKIEVNSNHLWTLDVSNAPALTNLTSYHVNEVILSNNVELESIFISDSDISALDFSGYESLKFVRLYECSNIHSLSIMDSLVIENVDCYLTGLAALDLNPAVTDVALSNRGNIRVSVTDNSYDLKDLAPIIEGDRISNFTTQIWSSYKNVTIDDTVISGYGVGEYIDYDYDCGNGQIIPVTIEIRSISNSWVTELTMEDWTYGQTPSEPFAEAEKGTVEYAYSDSKDGTYTKTKPTTAGTWYVRASVPYTGYYDKLEPLIVEFEIKRAVPEYTLPADLKGYVGQTIADVKLPDGFEWRENTDLVLTRPSKAGINMKYGIKYVPKDTDNYVTVYNLSVGIEVITCGDVNGDDVIDIKDAVAIKKYIAGTGESIVTADSDVNADGVIDVKDAVKLMKFLAGQDVVLGEAS